jgi:predicted TIM-barrel fold metal-dependent hydrolase
MVIDFHTHIFPPEVRDKRENFFDGEPEFKTLYSIAGSRLSGIEELIRNMDEEEIDKSVVFGFPWHKEVYFKRNNDYIMEAVEKFKERVIGFSTFHPLAKGAEGELERCLRSGFLGVGELAFYSSAMGERTYKALKPIAEVAIRFDVPILLHANEPIGHHYPGKAPIRVKEIYDLLRCFPENRIILAHWGGGIFFYHLMKREVKSVLQNTWFDTAASPFLYDTEVYSISTKIVGKDKILFGSDFPLLKPSRYFKEMKEAGLPQDIIRKICGQNAASLLRIGAGEQG